MVATYYIGEIEINPNDNPDVETEQAKYNSLVVKIGITRALTVAELAISPVGVELTVSIMDGAITLIYTGTVDELISRNGYSQIEIKNVTLTIETGD